MARTTGESRSRRGAGIFVIARFCLVAPMVAAHLVVAWSDYVRLFAGAASIAGPLRLSQGCTLFFIVLRRERTPAAAGPEPLPTRPLAQPPPGTPDGAGKSTLMRTLATLQEPDAGSAHLRDIDVLRDKQRVRETLGYLPQEFGVYPNDSAERLLARAQDHHEAGFQMSLLGPRTGFGS